MHFILSLEKLEIILKIFPICNIVEFSDTYLKVKENFIFLTRSKPLQGYTVKKIGENNKYNSIENDDFDFLETEAEEFLSFTFTRYYLATNSKFFVDVIKTEEEKYLVIYTLKEKEQFPDVLKEFDVNIVPNKVSFVLSERTFLQKDPLSFYKLEAKDIGNEWLEKAYEGKYKEYLSILDGRKGYCLSVVNQKVLDEHFPDSSKNTEFIRALRICTSFRFPRLSRALRLRPETLQRVDLILIDMFNIEGLEYWGNVSKARAKKMSDFAKSNMFG